VVESAFPTWSADFRGSLGGVNERHGIIREKVV